MLAKQIAVLLFLLPLTHVCAQPVSFQTFLSEFEKGECLDSTSFGDCRTSGVIDHERYSRFLPPADDECRCEPVLWHKGSYLEYKNFIVVMLQRYCPDYPDGNCKWLMENDGVDCMLITYSRDGKVLDYKTVWHSGAAYVARVEAIGNGLGLAVEQGVLDDCSLLFQYKDLVYTVCKYEYILKPDGMIEERSAGAPYKKVVDVMSGIKQFSFEQFRAYFKKWDKPYVDHTLFSFSGDSAELPFESCLSLIPDTLDHNSWPRDLRWMPCRYIETEKGFSFFLVKDCMTPKAGLAPYTDYMILEFHKNGMFNCAVNICHSDDDNFNMDGGMSALYALITKKLNALYTEGVIR